MSGRKERGEGARRWQSMAIEGSREKAKAGGTVAARRDGDESDEVKR